MIQKILLIIIILSNISCKINNNTKDCTLFSIKDLSFKNPTIYEFPILFKKGSHELLNNDFTPKWYSAYCAINKPSHFKSEQEMMKFIDISQIDKFGMSYFEKLYQEYKSSKRGVKRLYHKDYHLLFSGIIYVSNDKTNEEFLLVGGKSYIDKVSDYDKNTVFYKDYIKSLFAFIKKDNVYKHIDINYLFQNFTNEEYSKVNNILSIDFISKNHLCLNKINNSQKSTFKKNEFPDWVINKSKKTIANTM